MRMTSKWKYTFFHIQMFILFFTSVYFIFCIIIVHKRHSLVLIIDIAWQSAVTFTRLRVWYFAKQANHDVFVLCYKMMLTLFGRLKPFFDDMMTLRHFSSSVFPGRVYDLRVNLLAINCWPKPDKSQKPHHNDEKDWTFDTVECQVDDIVLIYSHANHQTAGV